VIAGTHDLALFALTVLVLNATPGVDMAYTLVSTPRGGMRAGLAATAGICCGCVVHLPAAGAPAASPTTATAAAIWRQGLLINALNPKVALFFLALLPQFIDADAAHKTAAFLLLGAWSVLQGALFLVLFVVLVAPLARLQPRDWTRRALQCGGGALFAVLALRLAWAERP
jgi:threonine/homoserine/homoserine lactone efflux protein